MGELPEVLQLLVGELGLRRAAPADHVDLLHPARGQCVQRVPGDIGRPRLVRRLSEDPADIGRDVALTDDRDGFLGQVELWSR